MTNDQVVFSALVAVSFGAHVLVASRVGKGEHPLPKAPVLVEMDLVAPPPPPPPVPAPTPTAPPPEPAPTHAPPRAVAARDTAPRPAAKVDAPQIADDALRGASDPLDFTGAAVLSNDSGGWSVGGGPGVGAAPVPANPAPRPAPAAPSGPRYVAVGELSRAPRAPALNNELERNYPREARRSGIAGTAVLRITILPDGRVGTSRRVSESYPGFGEACERTVRSSVWSPPLDGRGQPVATEVSYTCRFEVNG